MTLFPLGGPGPGPYWPEGRFTPTPPTEEETVAEQVEGSRYVTALEEAGIATTLEEVNLEDLFRQNNIDLEDPEVQAILTKLQADLKGADTQAERDRLFGIVQISLKPLSEQHPAVPITPYQEALEMSGFTAGGIPAATSPQDVRGFFHQRQMTGFAEQPDTGWIRYSNGVLVNPNVPIGAAGGIVFEPGSDAPGSPGYLRNVNTWSPEKVADWKQRLVKSGYLSKDMAKGKGVDLTFLDALRVYHETRYQHGGKPIDSNLAGASGEAEYSLTAHDFQEQIKNDVREFWDQSFGGEPSDAELQAWTRFTTQTALKAQRALERRDVPTSTASGLAATEAEERLIREIQTSPQAVYQREALEENTSLRDALSSAVVATRSLSG